MYGTVGGCNCRGVVVRMRARVGSMVGATGVERVLVHGFDYGSDVVSCPFLWVWGVGGVLWMPCDLVAILMSFSAAKACTDFRLRSGLLIVVGIVSVSIYL